MGNWKVLLLFNRCFIYLERWRKDSGLHKCIILPCLPSSSLISKMIKHHSHSHRSAHDLIPQLSASTEPPKLSSAPRKSGRVQGFGQTYKCEGLLHMKVPNDGFGRPNYCRLLILKLWLAESKLSSHGMKNTSSITILTKDFLTQGSASPSRKQMLVIETKNKTKTNQHYHQNQPQTWANWQRGCKDLTTLIENSPSLEW